ncbi:thiolase family protein [Microbacterium suaedae]|uniref:thiolase family protein n=1 Tax=Microbacterium suaedae TaxID=2067813 RepID=UPI000DA20025|nr:thiolase family protein [Microbacterium suaedae]
MNTMNVSGVRVVGVGIHPYQSPTSTPYTSLGLAAVRQALGDAGITWADVDSAYVGTALIGAAVGRPMLRHLGATGIPIAQVENASASGSQAVRQAYLDVLSGNAEISIAIGVDKPAMRSDGFRESGHVDLVDGLVAPISHFALLAARYLRENGVGSEALARVSAKNHANGLRNAAAQRHDSITAEEILAEAPISGPLTKHQCCPVGEGAAAVIVASEAAIERLNLDRSRAIRIAASVSRSERVYPDGSFPDAELTRETTELALDAAGISVADLDVVEVHDAFSIEELVYIEAIGLSAPGRAAADVIDGQYDIGGRCAVSASGGLQSMGHPVGPTGVGQIVEITRQLRGEADGRQQPGARVGLAHMLGVGSVCIEHVLVDDHA